MSARIALQNAALSAEGPTLSLDLNSGESLAIVGRAASGKSRLIDVLAGSQGLLRGSCVVTGSLLRLDSVPGGRRQKPSSLAGGKGHGAAARATAALTATHLWEVRHRSLADLTGGQQRAAALLPALVSDARIVLIDGLLDGLDAWTQATTLDLLQGRLAEGQIIVVATSSASVAARMDELIVLNSGQVRFAGGQEDLLRSVGVSRIDVHTESRSAVQAIARPFEVTVTEEPFGIRFEAAEGQLLAAKLLQEGYGDVKFVILQNPTLELALRSII